MTEFLTETEKDAIRSFYKNDRMREAVKKVLLAGIYNNGILKPGEEADALKNFAITFTHQNPGASDEQVGRKLRSQYEGLMKIEEAFDHMATYEKKVEQKPKTNPAR